MLAPEFTAAIREKGLRPGDSVTFAGERQAYRVRAASGRFAILTKPFNLRKTVLYSIIDWERGVRGPDNMIFSHGYESDPDIAERMQELLEGSIEVSHRRELPIDIIKLSPRRES